MICDHPSITYTVVLYSAGCQAIATKYWFVIDNNTRNRSQLNSNCLNEGSTLWLNTLRPSQNARHFADDIFKCIFLNINVWISLKISLKFVPKFPIDNIPALVQIMAWRWPGAKPLPEPMMVSLLTHICVTRSQWVKPSTASTINTSSADVQATTNDASLSAGTVLTMKVCMFFSIIFKVVIKIHFAVIQNGNKMSFNIYALWVFLPPSISPSKMLSCHNMLYIWTLLSHLYMNLFPGRCERDNWYAEPTFRSALSTNPHPKTFYQQQKASP